MIASVDPPKFFHLRKVYLYCALAGAFGQPRVTFGQGYVLALRKFINIEVAYAKRNRRLK